MTPDQLKNKFEEYFGKGADIKTFFAPGRVNLIGEHIDYNGGYVFPGALTIGITALWRKRSDNKIILRSLNAAGAVTVDIDSDIAYDDKDDWGNYPKGVFNHLKKEGHTLVAADILYFSDLPDGAGLSSSAAIEVLTAYAALTVSGKKVDRVWLSQFAQKVENQYVGVNCGIMDQFSVANGKADHAILLNCDTLGFELVPFQLKDYSLAIMNTNKRRELADSKFNERRSECDKVLEIINAGRAANSEGKGIRSKDQMPERYINLCEVPFSEVEIFIKDSVLRKRARHVITENDRVLASVAVLKKGDLITFGKLLNESHASLKNDYEVTGHELDAIVEEAVNTTGCIGARMTGAGFGGCAIAIVQNSQLAAFKIKVSKNYRERTGLDAIFYVSAIGDGVHEILN